MYLGKYIGTVTSWHLFQSTKSRILVEFTVTSAQYMESVVLEVNVKKPRKWKIKENMLCLTQFYEEKNTIMSYRKFP